MLSKNLEKREYFLSIKEDNLTLKAKMILLFCGAVIGIINGFFGGGGGMICVPILQNVLHLEDKYSHATAIAIIFPISFISAVIYLLSGTLETIPLVTVGSGVVIGGIIGSFLLKWLPPKAIKVIFAIIMLLGGIRLII